MMMMTQTSRTRQSILLVLVLCVAGSLGFIPHQPHDRSQKVEGQRLQNNHRGERIHRTPPLTLISATPTIPSFSSDSIAVPPNVPPSPLSLPFDNLIEALEGGIGRARISWDCYRIGVDPLLFFNPEIPEERLDAGVTALIPDAKGFTRDDLTQLFISKRRTQSLGRTARQAMSRLLDPSSAAPTDAAVGIEANIAQISHISVSADGTTKLLVRLVQDGLEVEAVIIPWEETGRSTLCISSQVGCRQGCKFCATGRMGIIRSLTADEILAQTFLSRKVCRVLDIYPVDGIVFMGMGEPADNADAVVRAATVLTDGDQFGMAQAKVTISTVAPSPEAFHKLAQAPVALAWSVHAARDELRKEIVPTTRYTMKELRDGYLAALKQKGRKLRTSMIEVVLIAGVNDSSEEADHLADFILGMGQEVEHIKTLVNLIPFNDIGHPTYRKPTMESVWKFQDRLMARGVKCKIRSTRGDDESAACGQLATKKKKSNGADSISP